ncbi:MAG: oligopeptide transporter, OPT family, partial [Acidobacteriaceae bacterium]|nr:oligopeptide transporter, OPT family [Acidobacteriaceae bacterium]
GVIRGVADWVARRRGYNEAQKARVENAGVLTASGLIAGEAVLGLVWAGLQFAPASLREHLQLLRHPSYLLGLVVMVGLAWVMVRLPLSSAGSPDEPAPPTSMM